MTSTPTKPVDNVVIATKGLQDRNTNIIAGTTVENKGKLIITRAIRIYQYAVNTCILFYKRTSMGLENGSYEKPVYGCCMISKNVSSTTFLEITTHFL